MDIPDEGHLYSRTVWRPNQLILMIVATLDSKTRLI